MANIKKIKIVFVVVSATLIVILSTGTRVTTKRRAIVSYPEKIIYCRISGFDLLLISPEGAFPSWINDIYIELKEEVVLPMSGQTTYLASRDFKTRCDEITSGTAVVNLQNKIVKIDFSYNDKYKWQRVNGHFPIETIEK